MTAVAPLHNMSSLQLGGGGCDTGHLMAAVLPRVGVCTRARKHVAGYCRRVAASRVPARAVSGPGLGAIPRLAGGPGPVPGLTPVFLP